MATIQKLILVTGEAGSGKSTLLFRLADKLRKNHRLGGFIMRGTDRSRGELLGAAERYDLVPADRRGQDERLWADRDGEKCVFRDETRIFAESLVSEQCTASRMKRPEVMFIDEIGRLEVSGGGFAKLFRTALSSEIPFLIAVIKKKACAEILSEFQLDQANLFDLSGESMDSERAFREIIRLIDARDSEQIGAFAGLQGLVEVGLGSMLRALHVPLKGHFLAYLQNILLITFGKSLGGRGLFRISFISAMLKAFSPVGGTVRPMLYILLQGGIFALPTAVVGFNLAGVILGSILMAWLTLTIKLLLDYLIFGMAFFDAYAGAVAKASEWANVQGVSLTMVIVGAFVLKSLIAAALAAAAYIWDMTPLLKRLRVRPSWVPAPRMDMYSCNADGNAKADAAFRAPDGSENGGSELLRQQNEASAGQKKTKLGKAARGALRDILNWKFVLFFFISILLMLFFANMKTADLAAVAIRGLCISYVGFLALRSVDFYRLGVRLDRRFGLGLESSLPKAVEALARGRAEMDAGNARSPETEKSDSDKTS